jgi:hypothetical protein
MRLHHVVALAVGMACLGACSRAVRPQPGYAYPDPDYGRPEGIRTMSGQYEGYSVTHWPRQVPKKDEKFGVDEYGIAAVVSVKGHGARDWLVKNDAEQSMDVEALKALGLVSTSRVGPLEWGALSGTGLLVVTRSYAYVDPLIRHFGRLLREGGGKGEVFIIVWITEGSPEDVRTVFGQREGYFVDWCRRHKGVRGRQMAVVTGQGSRPLPRKMHYPDSSDMRGHISPEWRQLAGAMGATGHWPLNVVQGCYTDYSVMVWIRSYREMDSAIEGVGRALKAGDYSGEVTIEVAEPHEPSYFYLEQHSGTQPPKSSRPSNNRSAPGW